MEKHARQLYLYLSISDPLFYVENEFVLVGVYHDSELNQFAGLSHACFCNRQ